ncbi:MAG: DUF2764 family protein [Lentisphaeria bacterium]|nr:DUF2764 family protein [Lentisphaeria bacterium]
MGYFALISSLPMLTLDGTNAITAEQFLSCCETYVTEKELRILQELKFPPSPEDFEPSTFAGRYAAWECALRNAVVRIRANKTGRSAGKYLNPEGGIEADAERAVSAAWAVGNPLERERILDQARWMKLEELESGTLFSFEQLCAYKLKLLLQKKWNDRSEKQAAYNLEASIDAVLNSIETNTKQEI